jgi:hypothetical protein
MEHGKPMKQSLAIAYAMKRKKKAMGGCMAEGGEVDGDMMMDQPDEPKKKKSPEAEIRKSFIGHYGEGGEIDEGDDDIVGRIMRKHYSHGGQVANATPVSADFEKDEFDDLVKDDSLEFHETGANSGDELGDHAVDEDERDLIHRIMKSRAKKDKLPRPA